MNKPKEKVVLLPGASRPIGRAIARIFGKNGYYLVLPVFDWPESIAEMKIEFDQAGFTYLAIDGDLRDKYNIQKIRDLITTEYGHLDILINNIERGGMPVVHGSYDAPLNTDQWDLEFDTTVKAKWLLFHYLFPLLQNSSDGAVVNISSIAGLVGRTGSAAPFFNDGFSAANRAVGSFTEQWAREAAPHVRVNEIMVGFIQGRHGEGTRGWEALTAEEKKQLRNDIPLQRTGLPEEVAELVCFIALQARYMTGAVLRLDGGYVLGSAKVPPIPLGIL